MSTCRKKKSQFRVKNKSTSYELRNHKNDLEQQRKERLQVGAIDYWHLVFSLTNQMIITFILLHFLYKIMILPLLIFFILFF